MPPPLPYFKVNICPLPLPHFASIFFAYLWSFRWPNYIVTLPKYFSFRLPHLNINTGPPPLRRIGQEYSAKVAFPIFQSLKRIQLTPCRFFRPCELLSSLFVRRPSVNISHFNLLLRNHWANCNQTLVEWSLDGPLLPTSNQDGRQAKNRKKGDEILIVHCCFSINQNELKF
jgi:hypothetical protein